MPGSPVRTSAPSARTRARQGLACALFVLFACGREDSPPVGGPKGKPKEQDTKVLETSSEALQSFEPAAALDVYLNGFHVMKDDASHVSEAHHYCRARNEEFTQCVIFDGNTESANLVGIEYIISERLFASLPEAEKPLWHPHNYEILSGQLVAPGLPEVAERALLEKKLNSYGKTWHVWDTSRPEHGSLPLGPAQLAWSFNADGELSERLLTERDKRMNLDSNQRREARSELARHAHPQRGVDAMSQAFPARRVPQPIDEHDAR